LPARRAPNLHTEDTKPWRPDAKAMSAAQPATNWASEYPQGVVPKVQPAEASGPQYMPLNLNYPGLRKVCQTPPVYVCDNFLTFDECDAFISTAGPLLQRSKTHAIAGASLLLPQQKSIFPPLRVSALNEHPCVLTDTCLSQTPPLTTLPPPCVAGSEATKGRTSLTCHLAKTTYPSPILLQKIQAVHGQSAVRRALRRGRPAHGRRARLLRQWWPAGRHRALLPKRCRQGRSYGI
jgi:hypothetical protein